MSDERFHHFGPPVIIPCLFEQAGVLAYRLILTVEQGTTREILEMLRAPSELHALFQAHAMTLVEHAVVEIDESAHHMHEIHLEGRIALLGPRQISIHQVAELTDTAQRQIPHHDNSPCGLTLLRLGLVQHSHPVLPVDEMLHFKLVVEVLIFEPSRPHPSGQDQQYQAVERGCQPSTHRLTFCLSPAVAKRHDEEESRQEEVRDVIQPVSLSHKEERQLHPVDVRDMRLIVDEMIVKERHPHHSHERDDSGQHLSPYSAVKSPGEHPHKQCRSERIDPHERISHGHHQQQ